MNISLCFFNGLSLSCQFKIWYQFTYHKRTRKCVRVFLNIFFVRKSCDFNPDSCLIQAFDRPYLLPRVVAVPVAYIARFSAVVVAAQSIRPLVIWSGFLSSSFVSFPSAASVKPHAQFLSEFLLSSENIEISNNLLR